MGLFDRAIDYVRGLPKRGFLRIPDKLEEHERAAVKSTKSLGLNWTVSEVTGVGIVNVPDPFPKYLDPRPAHWSLLPCPVCYEEQCYITSSVQTLMGGYSPPGHDHDPNNVTVYVACPNHHEFVYVRANPCPACDYGHEAPRITEIEGRRINRIPRISPDDIYTVGDKPPKVILNGKPKFFIGEPKFVGQMPVRQDIEIIPADEPKYATLK